MSKPTRRTAAERIEAKQARAYVEESRRRARAVVQQATVDQVNAIVEQLAAEPAPRPVPKQRRAHIYTACVILLAIVCSIPSALTIALIHYLLTRP